MRSPDSPQSLAVAGSALAVAMSLAPGCAGWDFTPSSVDEWSDARFSFADVTEIVIAPVADVRGIGRGQTVTTTVAVRSAAESLLQEKGYTVVLSGSPLLETSGRIDADAVLEPVGVSKRSGEAGRLVLAIAIEATEPDVAVAPPSTRVRLRGALVDTRAGRTVWAATSVAESGAVSGAVRISPSAMTYSAVYQTTRALLADLPSRPVISLPEARLPSGTVSPARAIE